MAKITFLGAAGTVTGSKYLVEAGGKKLLVDFGFFLGPRHMHPRTRNPIHSDAATRELCQLLLLDSAHLQEEDAKYAAKKKYSSHPNPLPLYSTPDAQAALNQFKEIPRADSFTISPEFSVRTHDAGHILGSCWLELTVTENGKQMVIVFSGDVGRYDQPILNDPTPPSRADFLLCETT